MVVLLARGQLTMFEEQFTDTVDVVVQEVRGALRKALHEKRQQGLCLAIRLAQSLRQTVRERDRQTVMRQHLTTQQPCQRTKSARPRLTS